MAQTRDQKVKNANFSNLLAGGSLSNAYYKHAVVYGDYCDLRIYHDTKFTFNGIDTSKTRAEDGQRRSDSLSRAKVKLYRLIVGNIGQHGKYRPIFATYTFKEPVEHLDLALKKLKVYLTSLKRHLGYRPKYVAVPQIQWQRYKKTGFKVWHFHICFFNVPKLDFEINDQMWGHGTVNLQYVKGVRNIGAYLAGYFTKEDWQVIPFNSKFYYPSRYLLQPQDIYQLDTIDAVLNRDTVFPVSFYEGNTFTQIKYKLR